MAALTERRLLAAAGETSFARGEDYVRYVRGLRVDGERARASVQGKRVYVVELDWARAGLRSSCTCPHFDDGNFCKHLVAVGLTVLDQQAGSDSTVEADELAATIGALDPDQLRGLLLDIARRDPETRRALELRAASSTGDIEGVAEQLTAMVSEGLRTRGHVDYRRSFEVASDAEAVLDELEDVLDAGAVDAARPALLKAVTRLRKIVEYVDDSSGYLGSACQRAADLYARSCREGKPDGKKVASWLVRFRETSPGWPQLELADFAAAFDDSALAAYRRGVDKLDRALADKDHWGRHEVDLMLLELADHDGDVEGAVRLLSREGHVQYGAIVNRLRESGRTEDAVEWMDRGVAEGRLDIHGRSDDYWLDYDDVAHTYRRLGRVDDAFAVLRHRFESQPGLGTFRLLLDHAVDEGRWDGERQWALDRAHEVAQQPYGSGAALIEIALGEGDLDAAWAAARVHGAGYQWQALADASAEARPIEAAELYRPGIEKDLTHPDSSKYPDIAKRLVVMRDLYARGGEAETFTDYVAELRATYKRRPSLMNALDRQRL